MPADQLSDSRLSALEGLTDVIVNCRKCPRLVEFREVVSLKKRKQFALEEYWGRPIAGFGDPEARLLVVGLAPAAHGGNRTGRVFTGDNSARFLVKHLYDAGFASQPSSVYIGDGLQYVDCYVTAAVRCVPPDNKPSREEMDRCFPYLIQEFSLLPQIRVILALGKIAFDSVIGLAKRKCAVAEKFEFQHGRKYMVDNSFPIIFASYHPSPRNVNTGKMTDEMFSRILRDINKTLSRPVSFHGM